MERGTQNQVFRINMHHFLTFRPDTYYYGKNSKVVLRFPFLKVFVVWWKSSSISGCTCIQEGRLKDSSRKGVHVRQPSFQVFLKSRLNWFGDLSISVWHTASLYFNNMCLLTYTKKLSLKLHMSTKLNLIGFYKYPLYNWLTYYYESHYLYP